MTSQLKTRSRRKSGGTHSQFAPELQHQISYLATDALKPSKRNARLHGKRQLKLICDSIVQFGFNNPIIVDANQQIIAGHGRWEAATLLNLKKVPVVRLEHLSEPAKRAYMLADNRLAELAGWDQERLALEFKDLLEIDAEFDLSVTGFDTTEIDITIQSLDKPKTNTVEDEIPDTLAKSTVASQVGDCWVLGEHKLLCADATELTSYRQLLGRKKVRQVLTDPPFNVAVNGHISGLGKHKHREFVMASGEMSQEEFSAFLNIVLQNVQSTLMPGALVFAFMDGNHLYELFLAAKPVFGDIKTLITWVKRNAGMSSFYRRQSEFLAVWKYGNAPHVNNFGLGSRRYRTNVWNYEGLNSFKRGREEELSIHPTCKPVAMIADAILDCSNRGDIILDPFAGSGTILVAAEKTGRRAYAMELDPIYVDVAVRRWEKFTGKKAVLEATGQTFDGVSKVRHG